jgi:hypothetical protein
MFNEITFYPLFGMPLIMWGGIATFIMFFVTAVLGYLNTQGKKLYSQHIWMARISLLFGLIHGGLGILSLF